MPYDHVTDLLPVRITQHELFIYAADLECVARHALAERGQRLRAWARPELLIIDDVGLGHLRKRDDEPTAAHTLYNLIDRRHANSSVAITSNIELSEWGKYLGDAIITTAILDRIVRNAIRIDITGPSYRQHVAKERSKTPKKKSS